MIVHVEEREYARLLGYPWGMDLEGDVRERAEGAADWYRCFGVPKLYCVPIDSRGGATECSPGREAGVFEGKQIQPRRGVRVIESFAPPGLHPSPNARHGLAPVATFCRRSAAVGITAGTEVDCEIDRLWREERVDEAYFLDRYAAAVVEAIARDVNAVGPGTAGIPFEQQRTLFSWLAPLHPELEILDSGMLKPKNSLLGFVIRDEPHNHDNPCTGCDLPGCGFRRRTT